MAQFPCKQASLGCVISGTCSYDGDNSARQNKIAGIFTLMSRLVITLQIGNRLHSPKCRTPQRDLNNLYERYQYIYAYNYNQINRAECIPPFSCLIVKRHLYNSGVELQIPTGMSFLIIYSSIHIQPDLVIDADEIDLNNLCRFHLYGQLDVALF
jgi:hypothetical protein